jgi:hypothetical protein
VGELFCSFGGKDGAAYHQRNIWMHSVAKRF